MTDHRIQGARRCWYALPGRKPSNRHAGITHCDVVSSTCKAVNDRPLLENMVPQNVCSMQIRTDFPTLSRLVLT